MALRFALHASSFLPRCHASWTKSFLPLFFVGALVGCESADKEKPKDPIVGANTTVLTDDHNYTSESILTPPIIQTAAGVDLTINWDMLTTDMQCHPMDPGADIDKMSLLRFRNLMHDQASALLTAGELEERDIDAYVQYDTMDDQTSAMLTDLNLFGTDVDILEQYVPSDAHLYMLLFGTTTTPGVGARTMVFIEPIEGNTRTVVNVEAGCNPDTGMGILEFSADLSETTAVVPDDPDGIFLIDWRGVTLDSIGNVFEYNRVTDILLGFYEGRTPAQIEQEILDIEIDYTEIWESEHPGGRQAALSALINRDTGDAFDGFDGYGEGTWLFALRCSDCQNPSPLVLTVLEPPASEP